MKTCVEANTNNNNNNNNHKAVNSLNHNSLKPNSFLVLVNPHSGTGKSVSIYNDNVKPLFNQQNVDHHVFITKIDLRVSEYLARLDIEQLINLRGILVVSGDGLLHEAINALMRRPDCDRAQTVPFGVIPTGSGNGLAYTLLRQKHPELNSKQEAIKICCQQAIQGQTRVSDLVKINYGNDTTTLWSFLSFGWGLLADIDVDSNWLRCLGEWRFTIYGLLRSVTSKSRRARLSYKSAFADTAIEESNSSNIPSECEKQPGWTHLEDNFTCLYAVYQSYISRLGNFAPKSTLNDHLIYLTYIRGKLNTRQIIEFLLAIQDGSHEKLSYVRVVPVTEFIFEPMEESKIVVDGEIISWTLADGRLKAEVVPDILKLLWDSPLN